MTISSQTIQTHSKSKCKVPGYHYEILDRKQLLNHPGLINLQRLYNLAFDNNNTSYESDGKTGRFEDPQEIPAYFGNHGRCILFFKCKGKSHHHDNKVDDKTGAAIDDTNQSESNGDHTKYDCEFDPTQPVAASMMRYFHPDLGWDPIDGIRDGDVEKGIGYESEPDDILSIEHWEPSCVAVLPTDPSLKGQGLAKHSIRLLEEDLLERLDHVEQQRERSMTATNGEQKPHNSSSSPSPLTFWIRTTASTTGSYWQRRGYETLHSKWFAVGTWRRDYEFQIMTLTKKVYRK